MSTPSCRFCNTTLAVTFADLGTTPLANSYVKEEDLGREPRYPLHARVCGECLLVQVEDVVPAEEIFSEYAYFSSYSTSWVEHSRAYVEAAVRVLDLGPDSRVVEVASNDGYLLQHFVERGIPALGVEPAANVAAAAIERGIPTEIAFFGTSAAADLLDRGLGADLVVANNVLAHVPDLNDFVAGLRALLNPAGVLTVEVPHLLHLIRGTQYDTIYHEHFSYFSLSSARRVLRAHGLRVFDVEQLGTHGGSLRIWACRSDDDRPERASVADVVACEQREGLAEVAAYAAFPEKVAARRQSVLDFLGEARPAGPVVGYGAAAKATTLLNHCGLNRGDIPFVVDKNPVKQGRFIPGAGVPIRGLDALREARPAHVLVFVWNIIAEVMAELPDVASWGGRFVTTMPRAGIVPEG